MVDSKVGNLECPGEGAGEIFGSVLIWPIFND
jgi:hypothetical protein